MRRWIAIAAMLVATPATARPLAQALARHTAADVFTLRGQSDPASRCTLGAIYVHRLDLPRAALYLTGCDQIELPDDIAAEITRLARDLKRRLDRSKLAKLDILSKPEGQAVEVDTLPDEPLTTPATVWLTPGRHELRVHHGDAIVVRMVEAEPHKDALVMIDAPPPPAAPKPQIVDIGQDDGSLGEEHTAPPPDVKRPSLIQGKYAGVPDAASEGPIADPLAPAPAAPPSPPRAWSIGARLGLGLFDDATTDLRAGPAVAIAARIAVPAWPGWFVATRLDWSRRGGGGETPGPGIEAEAAPGAYGAHYEPATAGAHAISSFGADVGLGVAVVRGLAVIGQLRGDLRFAPSDHVDYYHRIYRAGAYVAAGAELTEVLPFVLGVRIEQGVTPLVTDTRDRAVIFELGFDLR